jgi:hypothetical protein
MLQAIALLLIGNYLAPRTLSLLGSLAADDRDATRKRHTALRGLITGLPLGTDVGFAIAFIHAGWLQLVLVAGGLAIGLAWARLRASGHVRTVAADYALSYIAVGLIALLVTSSSLGLTGN